jgi:HlyD family secretion protein
MRKSMLRRLVTVAILAGLAGGAIYLVLRPETQAPIEGVVRGTEVRVAPEVGGHLATVRVTKGARVSKGDVIAELSAAELTTSVEQARAAYQSAVANRDNVYAGVRHEEVSASASEVGKARSRLGYAEQQLARFTRLTQDNFASRQALDQAQMQAAAARADVAEAVANHASARIGPTKAERAIADAQVSAAAAEVAVLESRLKKTVLTAPADGVVRVVAGEVGEAVRAGQIIVTIEVDGEPWLSFNVREDRLGGITVGSAVNVLTSGATGSTPGRVSEVASTGQFATWQAERAVGDHDRNTLRLRVDPQADLSKLEPGMTAWLVR